MKKIFTLIVIMGLIVTIGYDTKCSKITTTNIVQGKDRLQTIKEKGVLTFATSNDPPFAYINPETSQLDGVDADIITEIAKRLGINKVESKEIQFSDLLDKLNTDDSIDLAANAIFITPEREAIVSFTQPLYRESDIVIVPKASKINFKSDLKNAVVGTEKGTKFVDLVQDWKKNNLIKDVLIFNDTIELLNAINNGEVDAGVADSAIVDYTLKHTKLFLKTLTDYTPELSLPTGIAVKKKDTTLLTALNEKINEMKADGTLYAILVENGFDKNKMIKN
ncbi:polar amino acid transport system substrate-binding protein [Clostridium saccharoperbutylacetonicum]|uniref:Amino acid ABC transporter substrate-binding protein, PAAT family n=1 Tax=Clostridium saccharoperbutylacetonicum N1-4(HMT) TaxID=931276 RepID=M1LUZ1_9CLOT|nr:ABC transporter substrate-binding protein [Clostridium saccharoperbutylacetonicum]AGF56910.1 amino acid ABC transporter substrate-binding protein, PAAT family [Clostridium saccharoperbutylacetonicum N1-4(HMT)]NRT62331.1 polar amino acid transport system substrate-binding protein [Clostridium saccharoperbutylacetonicum]NSB25668.1 polar amino acid transport system substrate-binding protein [Clostridium saccharoperbutylacetonicum]NSB45034.1 polar amino acid transport system substrate-binding pr